jgi:hypothetical protein
VATRMPKQFLIEEVELIPGSTLIPIYFVIGDGADPKAGFAIEFVGHCPCIPESKALVSHEGELFEAHPATYGFPRYVSMKHGKRVIAVPVVRLESLPATKGG